MDWKPISTAPKGWQNDESISVGNFQITISDLTDKPKLIIAYVNDPNKPGWSYPCFWCRFPAGLSADLIKQARKTLKSEGRIS